LYSKSTAIKNVTTKISHINLQVKV